MKAIFFVSAMGKPLLLTILAATALAVALDSAPSSARPRPTGTAPSSAGSTPVVPRPSTPIAAQNNGNLTPKTFGGSAASSQSPVVNTFSVTTDI